MKNLIKILEKIKTDLSENINSLTIQSANAIDQQTIDSIRKVYGDDIKIRQDIDPLIIGGLKIKIHDLVIDLSINKKIKEFDNYLEKELSEGDDIFKNITSQIKNYQDSFEVKEQGELLSLKDGICKISGLTNCKYYELLELGKDKIPAVALNLNQNDIDAILLSEAKNLQQGDTVARTNRVLSIGTSEELLGRVVNPLGEIIDGKPQINYKTFASLEKIAPGVMQRKPVNTPLQTGIKAVDYLIPIGKGQRELILGDRQTGKTAVAIDTILNQKGQNIICIYVSIGQKDSKTAKIVYKLEKQGAMDYTIVVNAASSDPTGLQFLAPFAGVTLAEYFASKGKDVLIVYDDLSKHAVAYREISLLTNRPPGREAYPGDVFYLHSRLLERAGSFTNEIGGGSITALPIIETLAGDISAYIPTNVISITDGQIFLETDLFNKGVKPAVNVGLSVSRVGGAAQTKLVKKLAGSLKLFLAQYREVEAFSQLSSDLDETTKSQIEKGKRTIEILKQRNNNPYKVYEQVMVLFALNIGLFDEIELETLPEIEQKLIEELNLNTHVMDEIKKDQWNEEIQKVLVNFISKFKLLLNNE